MKPSTRRILASVGVLVFLAVWIIAAATIGTYLATAPKWLSLLFFIIAGIGWVFPLRPLFKWMNSGSAPD